MSDQVNGIQIKTFIEGPAHGLLAKFGNILEHILVQNLPG